MQSVKVVAVSEPKVLVDREAMSVDEFIAYVARVSNPSNQMNMETAPKLLRYLAKNAHWSPFEMVSICMEIETTRDIARQILRHRSFTFQEFSQRYADPVKDLSFEHREARLQDTKNRQNSIETDNEQLQRDWNQIQSNMQDMAKGAYKWAIENNIAKEQARAVLPEGLIQSRMYMNGTLRSWIHYCDLRMANGTQKEHREIATMAWEEIIKLFPSLKDVLAKSE